MQAGCSVYRLPDAVYVVAQIAVHGGGRVEAALVARISPATPAGTGAAVLTALDRFRVAESLDDLEIVAAIARHKEHGPPDGSGNWPAFHRDAKDAYVGALADGRLELISAPAGAEAPRAVRCPRDPAAIGAALLSLLPPG